MDLLGFLLDHGSVLLVVLALLTAGFGVPLPEDLVLLAAGAIAHRGQTPFLVVLAACFVGVLGGDSILFALARRFGERLVTHAPLRFILTPARRKRVHALFVERGSIAVFLGRHMSSLRGTVFVAAALEGVPYPTFIAWDALGAVLTVPAVMGLGYYFSAHVALVEARLAHAEHWMLAIVLALTFIAWLWFQRRSARKKL